MTSVDAYESVAAYVARAEAAEKEQAAKRARMLAHYTAQLATITQAVSAS